MQPELAAACTEKSGEQYGTANPDLSGTSIYSLYSGAVNSSAENEGTLRSGRKEGVPLVIAAPSKESGQPLYSQSKVFIAWGRHTVLNVIIHHWAVIALLGQEVTVCFVHVLGSSTNDWFIEIHQRGFHSAG